MCDAVLIKQELAELKEEFRLLRASLGIIPSGSPGIQKKQIPLSEFLEVYGMPRSSADRYIHRLEDPLPAYKQGSRFYIDIEEYKKWRVREDARMRTY